MILVDTVLASVGGGIKMPRQTRTHDALMARYSRFAALYPALYPAPDSALKPALG